MKKNGKTKLMDLLFPDSVFESDSYTRGFSIICLINVATMLLLGLAQIITIALTDDKNNPAPLTFLILFVLNINIIFTIVNVFIIDKFLGDKLKKYHLSSAITAIFVVLTIAVISIYKFELYNFSDPRVMAVYFIVFIFSSSAAVVPVQSFRFFEQGELRRTKFLNLPFEKRLKARLTFLATSTLFVALSMAIFSSIVPSSL